MMKDKFFPAVWQKYGEAWNGAVGEWRGIAQGLTKGMMGLFAIILILVKLGISYFTMGICFVIFYFVAKWVAAAALQWHLFKDVDYDTSIVVRPQWRKMGGTEQEWIDRKLFD